MGLQNSRYMSLLFCFCALSEKILPFCRIAAVDLGSSNSKWMAEKNQDWLIDHEFKKNWPKATLFKQSSKNENVRKMSQQENPLTSRGIDGGKKVKRLGYLVRGLYMINSELVMSTPFDLSENMRWKTDLNELVIYSMKVYKSSTC